MCCVITLSTAPQQVSPLRIIMKVTCTIFLHYYKQWMFLMLFLHTSCKRRPRIKLKRTKIIYLRPQLNFSHFYLLTCLRLFPGSSSSRQPCFLFRSWLGARDLLYKDQQHYNSLQPYQSKSRTITLHNYATVGSRKTAPWTWELSINITRRDFSD